MKKLTQNFKFFNLALATIWLPFLVNAQAPEQDCINAIPICQNQYTTTQSYVGSGINTNEIDSNISCLKEGEKNDVWYTFTVQVSGNLNFTITPNDMQDDYDWAVFNLTNANCASIFNTPSLSVSCNYSSTTGTTGPNGGSNLNNATANDVPYNATIPVVAGQTYVINVSNFSSSQAGYTIDFASSTAQIYDNVAPQLLAVNQPLACGTSLLHFNFSENILFTSVQNGDFTLTGPAGTYSLNNWGSPSQALGSAYGSSFTIQVSSALIAGNYTLSLVNASGSVTDLCGNVALPSSLTFLVNGITASISVSNVSCNGGNNGSAAISASSGTAPLLYNWSTGGGSNATGAILSAGTYTVIVTDVNGCTVMQTAIINEPDAMQIYETHTNVICAGETNGTANITVHGGSPAYTYSFNSQSGSSSFAGNLAAGLNQVTVTDANGCLGMIQFVLTEPNAVIANLSTNVPDTICNGQQVSLTANAAGGTPGYSYNWNNGTYFEDSIIVFPGTTTTYQLFATDVNGCKSQPKSITIYVYKTLQLHYITNAVCSGDFSKLSLVATGGDGQYSYKFMPGNLNGTQFTLMADSQVTYTITVSDGCLSNTVTDTIHFIVNPVPVSLFSMDVTEGCAPLTVHFNDESTISSGVIASWNWMFAGQNANDQNPDFCFTEKGYTKIKLVTVSDKGCASDTVMKKIKVFAQPDAHFIVDKYSKSVNNAGFHFSDSSAHAISWVWNFGDPNNATTKTIRNPYHQYSDTGTYKVSLIVFNEKGCSDTTYQEVIVFPVSKMFLPDAFTPNGDGLNDLFSLKGLYISEVDLTIFDRWGKLVFHTTNVNEGWDGMLNGSEMPLGVYAYIAKFKGSEGKNVVQDGMVTLVR